MKCQLLLLVIVLQAFANCGIADDRPNILFAIADDWGWPHASAYGDPVVSTPTFDRVARRGILFEIFRSKDSGRIERSRDEIFFGKERHVLCQEKPDTGGTPMRAIRNDDFLLIHNLRPDRWPAGTPDFENATIPGVWLGDCDNGPAKTYMVENKDCDEEHRRKYELSFGKRPEFELYDLKTDPQQLDNVAGSEKYSAVQNGLRKRLEAELRRTSDPRFIGGAEELFETTPYLGRGPRHPSTTKPKKR